MINEIESIPSQTKPIDSQSSMHFTSNLSNQKSKFNNYYFNSNNYKCNLASIIRNIKIKNNSSPKYNNKMKYNNKIITKHYSISSNVQSINDKKLKSKNLPKNPIITEPTCNLEKFLPPKKTQKHKTLVIDLDETLVHSYFDNYPPRKPHISFEINLNQKNVQVYTLIRPGAIEFLEKMSEFFEIVIFTASLRIYALPIINFMDKKKKCEFKLFREHCSTFNNGFIKDLKKLSRDLNNLILLDNNPNCYLLNNENAIPIKTWIDNINDKELYKIIPYLQFLSKEDIKDIRPILSKVKRNNEINYRIFNRIIEKYKENEDNNNNKKIINEEINKENNKDIIKEDNFIKSNYKINIEDKNKDNNNEKKNNENEIINKKDNNEEIDIINQMNINNNIINNITKDVNSSEKNNSEKKNFINPKNHENIKNNFKNKIKSSKENRFFISTVKNSKENYSENININNNLFNQKVNINQINSTKKNIINNTIKYSNRGIFINNNKNQIDNVVKKRVELVPPLINNNIKFSSKLRESQINNNKIKNSTYFDKDFSSENNYYQKEHFYTPINYDKFNSIYFYNNRKNKNNNKNNIQINLNDINSKCNDFSLGIGKINRSNSERKKLLYNYKSIEDNNKYNFNKSNKNLENAQINSNIKFNRSISITPSKRRTAQSVITKNNFYKKDFNNRCFSSHHYYLKNPKENKYNNISNNFIIENNSKCYDIKNKNKNNVRRMSGAINNIYLNKSNFINKADFSLCFNDIKQLNDDKYEVKFNFQKNIIINRKKSNIII